LVSRINPDGPYFAGGATIEYGYDAVGNRTFVKTPSGVTNYEYDEQNRLEKVIDPDLAETKYFYDAEGNLWKTELPNGVVETRTYDELNRLKLLQYQKNNVTLQSFDYTLDPVGHRRVVAEQNWPKVEYEYDDLYRLTKETIFAPVGGIERTISYGYDAVGNRLTKSDSVGGVTSYTYDDNDRLLREELKQNGGLVGSVEYGYDDNGNTQTRTNKNAARVVVETVTYSWNQENRLVEVQNSNGDVVSYSYDADGVRVSKTVNGVTTEYLVDKNRDYAQVLEESVNDVLAASYVYGLDLISQERGSEDSFYLVDGLGSTRGLTDVNGMVTDSYSYDAFGNLIGVSGGTNNDYLFAGEQFDGGLGQYYLRQRYYDFGTGRFTRRDTYEGNFEDPITLHKYLYGNANPVTYTDPTGLFSAAEAQAAADIASTLAGIQFESGGYLISATLKQGDYGLGDFITDLTVNAGITFGSMLLSRGISKALSAAADTLSVDRVAISNDVMKGLFYDVPVDDVISRATIRSFGNEIAASPIATATYSRLRELGIDIRLDFFSYPRDANGHKLVGLYTPGVSVDLYMGNAKNAKQAVEYLIHEGVHAERYAQFGLVARTRYEEYLAFRRQLLFAYGRKPTLAERREVWEFINEAYADLPIGKSPF
jgi:RHS repeat-associated protein